MAKVSVWILINRLVGISNAMKPTPRETKKIHENYEKVKQHLIDEKYAIDGDSADKIISGMSQDWFDTIVG